MQAGRILSAWNSPLKNLKCSSMTVARQICHLGMFYKPSQPQGVKQSQLSLPHIWHDYWFGLVRKQFLNLPGEGTKRPLTSNHQEPSAELCRDGCLLWVCWENNWKYPQGIKKQMVQKPLWGLQNDLSPNIRMGTVTNLCQGQLDVNSCCVCHW